MSHITHFYHLAALSYVQGPGMAPWTPFFDNSYYVAPLRNPGRLPKAVGDTTAEVWDKVIWDYVIALGMRRIALDVAALFGGRTPMELSLVCGGSTYKVDSAHIATARTKLEQIKNFIDNNYVPLAAIVSILYPAYDNSANGGQGIGAGRGNLLAWGVFDEDNLGDTGAGGVTNPNRLLKRGYILGGNPATAQGADPANVFEHIKYSRYADDPAKTVHKATGGLHPSTGYTNPDYSAGYSWAKAPRYRISGVDTPMEVGPLARMAVTAARGGTGTVYPLGQSITYGTHALLGMSAGSLTCGVSVMDRHRARALEAKRICDRMLESGGWLDQLDAIADGTSAFTPATLATNGSGYGAHEAPRGALAHWIEVTNGKISNYQAVVPTTWNVGCRDANDATGTIEECIMGTPVSGVQSGGQDVPVEVLRVVQSFDPCIACTVHVVDGEKLSGKEV